MRLFELLKKKEEKIVAVWVERTLDSYISSDFFKQATNQFANPVGANIRTGLTKILQLMLSEAEAQEYAEPLDQVIRIRAVQEFTPAQAVAPLFEVKWVVRQILSGDEQGRTLLSDSELAPFDREVDRVVLMAFDMYMRCRDRLYQARIRELKSGSYILTDSSCASAAIRENLQEIASLSGK
ncbi:MAG: hypothetical protein D3920_06845 [Candidatus Electrothrix sp. AW2]|nr:hypothetical protein [Candidatus Electrothrix sp. AX1]MCI5134781.1 hypothetical protein [Candidatus Electrothrix gigas]MCI5182191.1 hypothetical protein [Candidatus Electrothrix gigas]